MYFQYVIYTSRASKARVSRHVRLNYIFIPFFTGLNHHATILSHMFHLLEAGKIVAPLYDAAQTPGVSNNHVRHKHFTIPLKFCLTFCNHVT